MKNPKWTEAEQTAVSDALDFRVTDLMEMASGNGEDEDGGGAYTDKANVLIAAMRKFDTATT